jgi:predicted nucleic-acid-binding protein
MATKLIVLDANVVMEILEERRLYDAVADKLEQYAHEDVDFAISTLAVSHVFYLAEAHKIPVRRVEMLIKNYKVFDVLAEDVSWALAHYGQKDFEDALQVAASLREKCSAFLTIDKAMAKKYAKTLHIELISG